MKACIALALAAALAVPETVGAQPATSMVVTCGPGAADAAREVPNLHGAWDFLMSVGGTPNFGLLSIGPVDGGYGGSLSLWRTAPVVLRKVAVKGNDIHFATATPGGDVLFDGTLSASGDRMCGTVTYHEGRTFPAVAQKRPSTYQPQPQPERAQ
jgi:hypothetical protein